MERERALSPRAILVVFAAAMAAALIWAAVSLAGGSSGGSPEPAQGGATPSPFVQDGNGGGDENRTDHGRDCPNKGGDGGGGAGTSDTSAV